MKVQAFEPVSKLIPSLLKIIPTVMKSEMVAMKMLWQQGKERYCFPRSGMTAYSIFGVTTFQTVA